MYFSRLLQPEVEKSLEANPVTAILGPRQCGKSTLAKKIIEGKKNTLYLDLERPSDLRKLNDPEWFFSANREKLFCIDEIQRKPELFPTIRSLTDDWGKNGSFLVLGSASRELLRQSSESLAGRISYKYLTPFLYDEISSKFTIEEYFERGGFPRSILKETQERSFDWREDFITTFLEKDLSQYSGFSAVTMLKMWQMLAHNNGQTVNFSAFGNSLNVSNTTIRNYIELLSGTYMLDIVPPYFSNIGKRLVKAPKVYIKDAGITNALLGIRSYIQLTGHPVFGAVWESIVLLNLRAYFSKANFYFYRTSHGAEIDFIMEHSNRIIAIECKATLSPSFTKGNYLAKEDIKPEDTLIVAPVSKGWSMKDNIFVVNLLEAIELIKSTTIS